MASSMFVLFVDVFEDNLARGVLFSSMLLGSELHVGGEEPVEEWRMTTKSGGGLGHQSLL